MCCRLANPNGLHVNRPWTRLPGGWHDAAAGSKRMALSARTMEERFKNLHTDYKYYASLRGVLSNDYMYSVCASLYLVWFLGCAGEIDIIFRYILYILYIDITYRIILSSVC